MKIKFAQIIQMTVYLFFTAVVYNLFIVPINLVSGGTGGLGILINNVFGIDRSVVLFVVLGIITILSLLFLDKKQTFCALMVALIFPLAVKLTSDVSNLVEVNNSHKLIMTFFGAILSGAAQGLILSSGMNVGGLSVISKIIYKYTHFSITAATAIMNIIIVLLGAYFISIDMILYALIYIVVLRYVSERVMLGVSSNKTFKIISDKYEDIQNFIHEELKHDVTIYDTVGSFDKSKKKLIMAVVPTSEYIVLKDFVNSVDKKAFIFVANTYDINHQDETITKIKEKEV